MTSPKDAYDARQKLKRIARGDEPDEKTEAELKEDVWTDLMERFVRALEGIEMNMRGSK